MGKNELFAYSINRDELRISLRLVTTMKGLVRVKWRIVGK
jgi:hypothetical protein